MRITGFRTAIAQLPADEPLADGPTVKGTRDFVTLEIETDQPGLVGIGLTHFGGPVTPALRHTVDLLAQMLVGDDPLRIEAAGEKLRAAAGASLRPARVSSRSAARAASPRPRIASALQCRAASPPPLRSQRSARLRAASASTRVSSRQSSYSVPVARRGSEGGRGKASSWAAAGISAGPSSRRSARAEERGNTRRV